MRNTLLSFSSLLLSIVGHTQQNCKNCGVAYMREGLYDSKRKVVVISKYANFSKDYRFLFYDSMMIAERHALYPDTDPQKVHIEVMGYTFIDFRTKSFYNYRHFSDTAGIILAVRQPAKGRVKGGWNFFDPPLLHDSSTALSDTVLEGRSYHRQKRFHTKGGKAVAYEILYYVSEEDRPLAYFRKTIAGGKMASATRLDWPTATTDTMNFLSMEMGSTNLTKEELRVFTAWKKNAIKYPIPKNSEKLYILGPKGSFIVDKRPKYAVRG